MKIFSLFGIQGPRSGNTTPRHFDDTAPWLRDPLSHPALESMSQRELADLPFRTSARPTPMECCHPA